MLARRACATAPTPTSPGPTAPTRVTGMVTTERMSRTPDERLYSSGRLRQLSRSPSATSALAIRTAKTSRSPSAMPMAPSTLTGLPDGNWRITIFDQWNDMLVDGLSTPVIAYPAAQPTDMGADCHQPVAGEHLHHAPSSTRTATAFARTASTGLRWSRPTSGSATAASRTSTTPIWTALRASTKIFPLFSWYVVETDSTRYKNTGTHVVYDAGGPADGSTCGGTGANAPRLAETPTSAHFMANTDEQIPVPADSARAGRGLLRTMRIAPSQSDPAIRSDSSSGHHRHSTGRIDPPWVLTRRLAGIRGPEQLPRIRQDAVCGGRERRHPRTRGLCLDASVRRSAAAPAHSVGSPWFRTSPSTSTRKARRRTAVTSTLTLVDTTKTSSWDDWAQGFRSDGMPNMNCPGQGADTGTNADPVLLHAGQPAELPGLLQHDSTAAEPLHARCRTTRSSSAMTACTTGTSCSRRRTTACTSSPA